MQFKITLEANINSNLSAKELNSKLVLALYDTDIWYSKLDWVDDNLEVIDYTLINIEELCEDCNETMISRMFDIDASLVVSLKYNPSTQLVISFIASYSFLISFQYSAGSPL